MGVFSTSTGSTDFLRGAATPRVGADLPRNYVVELPQALLELSERERRRRAKGSETELTLDDCRFFARGHLNIPIQGQAEPLCWDCWVELKERGHLVLVCTAREQERDSLVPLAATLANLLPPFDGVIGAEVLLELQPLGVLPNIVLREPGPLTDLQREGLTAGEFRALAIDLLHNTRGALASLGR